MGRRQGVRCLLACYPLKLLYPRLHPPDLTPCRLVVQVGDIIRLEAGDAIPADLLLLHTSDPSGVAFVDTSNLDGETNLKARSLFYERPDLGSSAPPPFAPARFLKAVQCDQPSVKIYSFNGFIEHENHRVVLSAENLLLRDCILRNTDEVCVNCPLSSACPCIAPFFVPS